MSKFVNRIAAVAALALAATPIVGLSVAHAAEPGQFIARIPVGDLRLSDPADAHQFQRRALAAGRKACEAQGVSGLHARNCLAGFQQDLKAAMTPTQISALQSARQVAPMSVAALDF